MIYTPQNLIFYVNREDPVGQPNLPYLGGDQSKK